MECPLNSSNEDDLNGEMHREIGDVNLAYMLLAQKLVKQDKAAAMFRLGINQELAELLASMSLGQIVKLAASNLLLCSFRLANAPMLTVVSDEKTSGLQMAHMSILMAARQARPVPVFA
jgi:flagellar transcriptional activator FlhD